MTNGLVKLLSNRWFGRIVRNALVSDFVRCVRVMPGNVPLSRIWRNQSLGYGHTFVASFAGLKLATIGGLDVRRYTRDATLSQIKLSRLGQELDLTLPLLRGFAKALRAGYGINAVILSELYDDDSQGQAAVFQSLGAVRIGARSTSTRWIWRTNVSGPQEARLDFQRRYSGALDAGTGVSIHNFRTEYGGPSPPDYLFNLDRNGHRSKGMGFSGIHHYWAEKDGKHESVYSLDATHPNVLRILLDFRELMPTTEDDFSFLEALAKGFVLATSGGNNGSSHHSSRYPFVTTAAALVEVGVPLPAHVPVAEDGTVILAEVIVPIKEESEEA